MYIQNQLSRNCDAQLQPIFLFVETFGKGIVPSGMEPFSKWEPMPFYAKHIADSALSSLDFGLCSSAATVL